MKKGELLSYDVVGLEELQKRPDRGDLAKVLGLQLEAVLNGETGQGLDPNQLARLIEGQILILLEK